VARSLHTRQEFTVSLGLALWERYTRDALAALAGDACYVLRYEDLLAGPQDAVTGVGTWLAGRGAIGPPSDAALAAAAASVSGGLARHEGEGVVPESITTAAAALDSLGGAHDAFAAPPLLVPDGWMEDALEQQRAYEALYARYLRYVKWRRRIPLIGRSARARD
jgi:hypothetical protein